MKKVTKQLKSDHLEALTLMSLHFMENFRIYPKIHSYFYRFPSTKIRINLPIISVRRAF